MILTLYQASGTDKAGFFMLVPRGGPVTTACRSHGVWIPKSCYQVHERQEPGVYRWPSCTVEVADWWARRHGLAARQKASQEHIAKNIETPT